MNDAGRLRRPQAPPAISPSLRVRQMRPAGFLLRPLDMELSLPHRLRRFLEHNLTQTTKAANGGVAIIAPCRPSKAKKPEGRNSPPRGRLGDKINTSTGRRRRPTYPLQKKTSDNPPPQNKKMARRDNMYHLPGRSCS